MPFGFFGSKKKNIADLLAEQVTYQQVVGHLAKAQSLQKLGRNDEARQVLLEAECMAINYLNQNPREKKAHLTLAMLYVESGIVDRAEAIIDRFLKSGEFQLTVEERLGLEGELQKIRRERPYNHRSFEGPQEFTKVYCCQNCGRLHNFVSMPCPHCDWSPQTIEEMARSIILSNPYIKIPGLLILSRQMANGRQASDVVLNLNKDGQTYLSVPKQRQVVEQVFTFLRQNEYKNHRNLNILLECVGCNTRVSFSGSEKCEKCGAPVQWPDAIRAIACMDNLLWLLEQRVEVSSADAFTEFVCLLVAMVNDLLRKQEPPSEQRRKYAISLLRTIVAISDLNKGAIIDTSDPRDLKIYLVKDDMREDSEIFGSFLFKELELFIEKMVKGVVI